MLTTPALRRPPPLPALTGVRFFAALYVVLYHYAGDALADAHWSVRAFIASGPSAVGLFYVLSGAVLVYSGATEEGGLAASRRSFWRARFARIYPTYLVALLISAPFFVSAVLKTHSGADAVLWGVGLALPALLLVHAWTALTVFAWNTPGWSVSAEAFFYAVFPSVVGRLRSGSLPQLLRRAFVFYGLALIPPLIVTAAQFPPSPFLQVQVPSGLDGLDLQTWIVRLCGFSPLARLPEFLMGICLGHWLRARRTNHATFSAGRAASLEMPTLVVMAGALVALGLHPDSKPWLDSGLLSPVFLVLVAALAIGTGPIARLLSSRPLQVLGDASYAMYVLQEPVLIWMTHVPVVRALPARLFVAVFVVVLIGASLACQRFLAEPARAWLLARRERARQPSPVAVQPLL
jgi:peptidoglycan/LPS O-acetylase OafA/YrhL